MFARTPASDCRAHRLDPRLLDRLEHLGCPRIHHGLWPGVQPLVGLAQPQRQPVRLTAASRSSAPAGSRERMGQGQDAVGQPRSIRTEQHLQLRLLRQRPRGEG